MRVVFFVVDIVSQAEGLPRWPLKCRNLVVSHYEFVFVSIVVWFGVRLPREEYVAREAGREEAGLIGVCPMSARENCDLTRGRGWEW